MRFICASTQFVSDSKGREIIDALELPSDCYELFSGFVEGEVEWGDF
jgi:hypothetical protein